MPCVVALSLLLLMRSISLPEFQFCLLDLLARHEGPLGKLLDYLESLFELGFR